MNRYTCVSFNRDNSNNIISCVLRDENGHVNTYAKEDVKRELAQKTIFITNLGLTKDGRLIMRDNLIDEYIKSCQCLGIEPLDIEHIGNDYIIIGIPNRDSLMKIPPFVTGIQVNSKLSRKNTNNITSSSVVSINQGDMEIILRALANTQNKIKLQNDEIKNEVLSQSNKLDMMMNSMGKLDNLDNSMISNDNKLNDLEQILNAMISDNKDVDILSGMNDLKQEILENGRKMVELQNAVEPTLQTITQNLSQNLTPETFENSDLLNMKSLPQFNGMIRKESDYWCNNEQDYTTKLSAWNSNSGMESIFLPFEVIEPLKGHLECLYQYLIELRKQFADVGENESIQLNNFKDSVEGFKDNLDVFSGFNQFTDINDPISCAVDAFKMTACNVYKTKKSIQKKEIIRKIYDRQTSLMDMFYNETDRDIAILAIESDVKKYKVLKAESYEKYVYYDLFKFMTNSYSNADIQWDDEIENRLATAYVVAKKVVRGEIATPLRITPNNYDLVDDMAFNKKLNKSGNERYKKERAFYNMIHLSVFCTLLLLLGFTPQYIYTRVYDNLYMQLYNKKECFSLRKEDLITMCFDIANYI